MVKKVSTQRLANQYHENVLETSSKHIDFIHPEEAKSLYGLFKIRASKTPNAIAYIQFCEKTSQWHSYAWRDIDEQVDLWRRRMMCYQFKQGDRVAILLKNSIEWVIFDLACQAEGIINVPLYVGDRADNMAYIIDETQCKLLLIGSANHWMQLYQGKSIDNPSLENILVVDDFDACADERVISVSNWLAETPEDCILEDRSLTNRMDETATIVYTSGTTGRPKGVMLSHQNILTNAYASGQKVAVEKDSRLLSFLPLSHTFERTLGYYLPMMSGACVQYARSIALLSDDLLLSRPNMMIAVPRIFERVSNKIHSQLAQESVIKRALFHLAVNIGWQKFQHAQGRAPYSIKFLLWPILNRLVAKKVRDKFGGQLEFVICGGAPLSLGVAKLFIGLGVNLVQGYGLTETSPVLSGNKVDDNIPDSIGLPLIGVELKLGENDELLAKGPNIMKGYWANEEATKEAFTEDGWFKTGDIASINESGYLYIVGRVKEILVLSNGEKVPPADIEAAIMEDSLFEQTMVIGEGRSFLSMIAVLQKEQWEKIAEENNLDSNDDDAINSESVHQLVLEKIKPLLSSFPGYAQVYKVHLTTQAWTNEEDLITPTLKLKRPKLMKKFEPAISAMYKGH